MSVKSYFRHNYREFDAERDRQKLPLFWILGVISLLSGALFLILGIGESLNICLMSLVCFSNAFWILRIAFTARRKIKEFDALKSLNTAA